jgi:threonine aldolase
VSPAPLSDFRSDTVTLPSAAMRAAMADAEVGDDVLDGDPTVRRLEERAAAWLGKEGALFVPSGTMANQVALGASTRPGDEMIVERSAHAVCWEGGAAAAFHGVQTVTLHAEVTPHGVEDASEAAGESNDGDPLSATLGDLEGPGPECSGFLAPGANDPPCGLDEEVPCA